VGTTTSVDSGPTIVDFDWLSNGDIIAVTDTQDLISICESSTKILYVGTSVYGCMSLPPKRDTGQSMLALSCDTGGVGIFSGDGNVVYGDFQVNHVTCGMSFLGENKMLCSIGHSICENEEVYSLLFHPIHGLTRERSGGDVSPRGANNYSSTTLHTSGSAASALGVPQDDEQSRKILSLFGRRVRRLGYQVSFGFDDFSLELSFPVFLVGEDEDDQEVRLKILVQMTTTIAEELTGGLLVGQIDQQSGAMTKFDITFEVWWAGSILPKRLISGEKISKKFLSSINLVNGDIPTEPFLEIKKFIAQEYPTPSPYSDLIGFPFPATCGVCWSPKGDLYRFESLKGLNPFPSGRPKLTMKNYMLLRDSVGGPNGSTDVNSAVSHMLAPASIGGVSGSGNVSVKLNSFTDWLGDCSGGVEDWLDIEYNRRVTTDQCVQFLPSAVFEETVEDHWFASIAPVVDLSRKNPSEIVRAIHSFTQQFMMGDRVPIVLKSWEVVQQVFERRSAGDQNIVGMHACGLDSITASILDDEIKFLYEKEQTQAVAILASLLLLEQLRSRHHSTVISLHPSILLTLHDHSVLFQRLGCWKTARIIEDLVARYAPKIPRMVDLNGLSTTQLMICCVCDLSVIGLGQICRKCGHGGHLNHLNKYFAHSRKCPNIDCECECEGRNGVPPVLSRLTSLM
jgi:hypothetical protein